MSKSKVSVYILNNLDLIRQPTIDIGVLWYNKDNDLVNREDTVFDNENDAFVYVDFVKKTYIERIHQLHVDYEKAIHDILAERKRNLKRDVRKLKLQKLNEKG